MRQPSTHCPIFPSPHSSPSSSSSSLSRFALLAANLLFFAVSPVDANPAVWPSPSTWFPPAPSNSPHKRTCLDDVALDENRIKGSITASPISSPLPTRVVHRRNTVVDRYSQGIDGKWRIPTTSITLYGKTLCPVSFPPSFPPWHLASEVSVSTRSLSDHHHPFTTSIQYHCYLNRLPPSFLSLSLFPPSSSSTSSSPFSSSSLAMSHVYILQSCNTEDTMPTTTTTATYSLSSDIPYPSNGTLDEKYQAIRDKLPPGWTKLPSNVTYDHSPTVLGLSLACAFMIICIIACAAYWRKRDRAQSRAQKKHADLEKTSPKRGGKGASSGASVMTYSSSSSSSASIVSQAEEKQKKWARALAKWKSKVKASAKTRRERRAFAKTGAAPPSHDTEPDVVHGPEDELDEDDHDDEGPEEPIVASASAVSSSPRSSFDSQRSRRSSSSIRRSRSPSVLTAAPTASLRPSISRTAATAAAAATSAIEIHAGSSSAPAFEATVSPPAYPRSPSPLEKSLSHTYARSSQDDEGSNGSNSHYHHFLPPPPPPTTSALSSSSSSSSLSPSRISHRSSSVHSILPPPSPPPPLPYLTYSGHVATDDKRALGRMAEFASAPPAEAPIPGTSTAPLWLNEEEQLAEICRLETEGGGEGEEETGRRRSINGRRVSMAPAEFSTAGPSSSAPASTSLSAAAAAAMGSSLPPPPPASSSKGRLWTYDYAFDYAEGDVPVEMPSAPPFASHDEATWELHASAPPALDGMGEGEGEEEENLRALASAPPLLEDDEDDEEYANGLVGAGASSSSDDHRQARSSTGSVDGQDHDRHHHRHLSSASIRPGQRMSLTPLPLYRP